jgi:hypothetical protein
MNKANANLDGQPFGRELEQPITACKRHNPAAGATQGYDRLHAKRYGVVLNPYNQIINSEEHE